MQKTLCRELICSQKVTLIWVSADWALVVVFLRMLK